MSFDKQTGKVKTCNINIILGAVYGYGIASHKNCLGPLYQQLFNDDDVTSTQISKY